MQKYKEKRTLSRPDIADRLRRIADEVERGSVVAGEMQLSMPDQAEFELEAERDELEIKIEWSRTR